MEREGPVNSPQLMDYYWINLLSLEEHGGPAMCVCVCVEEQRREERRGVGRRGEGRRGEERRRQERRGARRRGENKGGEESGRGIKKENKEGMKDVKIK